MTRSYSEYSNAINQGLPPEDFEGRKLRLQQMLLELGGFKRPPVPEAAPSNQASGGQAVSAQPVSSKPKAAPKIVRQAQTINAMGLASEALPGLTGGAFNSLTEALANEWATKNGLTPRPKKPAGPNVTTNASTEFAPPLTTPIPSTKLPSLALPGSKPRRPNTYVDTYKPILDQAARQAGILEEERQAAMPVIDRALAYYYAENPNMKTQPVTEETIRKGLDIVAREEERPVREEYNKALDVLKGTEFESAIPGTFEEYKVKRAELLKEQELAEKSPVVSALSAPFRDAGDVGKTIGRAFFTAANTAGFNLPSAVDPEKYQLLMETLSTGGISDTIAESIGSVFGFLRGLGVVRGGVQGIRSLSATGAAERILQDPSLASRFIEKAKGLPIPGVIKANTHALTIGATLAGYSLPSRIVEVSGGHKTPELAAAETLIDFFGGTLAGKTKDVAVALVRNASKSLKGKQALAKFYNAMGQVAIGTAQEAGYSEIYGIPFDPTRAFVNAAQNFITALPEDVAAPLAKDQIHKEFSKFDEIFEKNESIIEEANQYEWQYDPDSDTYTRAAQEGEPGASRITATEEVRRILEARRRAPEGGEGTRVPDTQELPGDAETGASRPVDNNENVPGGAPAEAAIHGTPEDRGGAGRPQAAPQNRGRVVEIEGKLSKYERAPGEGFITRTTKAGKERKGIAFRGTAQEALAIDRYAVNIDPGKKKADSNLWLIDERHVVTPEAFGEEPAVRDLASYKTEISQAVEKEIQAPTSASAIPVKDKATFAAALKEIAPHLSDQDVEDLSLITDRIADSFKVLRGADFNFYEQFSLSNKPIEGHPDTLEAALYQGENAPAFYSALDNAIESIPQDKFSAEQLKGMLAKTPGVKAEEINWRGLDAFLAGKKSVGKQDVLDYLAERQVNITERAGDGSYNQYVVPGGKNYREIVFQLPGVGYKSPHFAPADYLAHARINDRVIDGKKTLFVEEIQSDLHQVGRRRGYEKLSKRQELARALTEEREQIADRQIIIHLQEQDIINSIKRRNPGAVDERGEDPWGYATPEEQKRILALDKERDLLNLRDAELDALDRAKTAAPDAPFKKTWHELVFKKLLDKAVREGYEQIAWTSGDIQAARYDLSKAVDKIKFTKTGADEIELGVNPDSPEYKIINTTRQKLPDLVGKEMAQKILGDSRASGELEGEDLRIGGEGMRGFYDKMLPGFVDKYLKKYGVSSRRLDKGIDYDESGDYSMDDGDADILGILPEGERYPGGDFYGSHVIEITPKLKEDILARGQPLFQKMSAQVYHGTAYEFDKFLNEHIGAGEGVQAFGYGHYFTESREIARDYAVKLASELQNQRGSGAIDIAFQGKDISDPGDVKVFTKPEDKSASPKDVALTALREMIFDEAMWSASDNLYMPPDPKKLGSAHIENWDKIKKQAAKYITSAWGDQPDALKALNKFKPEDFHVALYEPPKIVYRVDIKGEFVDYDAAPEPGLYDKFQQEYKKATGGGLPDTEISTWGDAYKSLYENVLLQEKTRLGVDDEDYKGTKRAERIAGEKSRDALMRLGIEGIRYPARYLSGGMEGVYNYVVFDPALTKIKDRILYQHPADPAMQRTKGAVQFLDTGHAVVHAFKSGDISTVIHEIGHVARRHLDQDSLTVLEDAYGIKDGLWTVDHEEAFSRGLERYMRSGVVPDDPKLLPVFRRIATFLRNLYQNLKGSPLAKQIPDGAKLVYEELLGDRAQARDRILDLSEQISFAKDMADAMPLMDEQAYLTVSDDAPTTTKLIQDAITTREIPEGDIPKYPGVQAGRDVRQDQSQIRQEEGGQAGGSRSPVGVAQEAPAASVKHYIVKEANSLADKTLPKPTEIGRLQSDILYQADDSLKPSDPNVEARIKAANISIEKAAKDSRALHKKIGSFFTDGLHAFSRTFRDLPKTGEFAQSFFGIMKAAKGAAIAKDYIGQRMRRISDTLDQTGQYLMSHYLIAANELENRRYGHIAQVADDIIKHYDETGSLKGLGITDKWLTDKGIEIPKGTKEIASRARLIARGMYDNGMVTLPKDSVKLKFGWTDDTLNADYANWQKEIDARPEVKKAVEDWRKLREEVGNEYASRYKAVTGKDLNFNRTDYLHQRTLAYLLTQSNAAAGGKPSNRGTKFRQARKDTELDYVTNIWEAQYYALSSLAADSKFYDYIIDEYSRSSVPILNDIKDIDDPLPEGYRLWKPPYGTKLSRPFDPQVVGELKEADVDGILDDALSRITGRKVTLQAMREGGGIFDRFVVKNEVASALDEMFKPKPQEHPSIQALKTGYRGAYNWWKWYTLNAPHKFFKAFVRNLAGDVEKIGLNPSAVKELKASATELYDHIFKGAEASPELKGWIERGGLQNLMAIQENIAYSDGIAYIKNSLAKQEMTTASYQSILKKAFEGLKFLSKDSAYGRKVNQLNNFREALIRYAQYRDYTGQARSGKLKNYGSSNPDYVDALASPEDKGWELSNKLMGAYDETSVAGVWMAKNLFPFHRFREANIKSYMGAIANVFREPSNARHMAELTNSTLGKAGAAEFLNRARRLGISSGALLIRAGKFIAGVHGLTAVLEAINLAQSDREKQLGEKARQESHVLLGGTDDDTYYFNRLSTFSEFLESLGLGAYKRDAYDVITGQKSFQEVFDKWTEDPGKMATEWAKNVTNYWAQGMAGWVTVPYGVAAKKSLFPDIWNPRTIRDPVEPFTSYMGVDEYWKAISPIPDNMTLPDVPLNLVVYRMEHRKRNYDLVRDKAMKYAIDNLGVNLRGGSYDEEASTYAFYMRQAIKLKDYGAGAHYLRKWVAHKLENPDYTLDKELGPDEYEKLSKSIVTSFRHLHPLSFIPEAERQGYIDSLTPDERAHLADALSYINELASDEDLYKRIREESGSMGDQWEALLGQALNFPVEDIELPPSGEEEQYVPLPLPGNYRK